MDNEVLWEVILGFAGGVPRAAESCRLIHAAAKCRAARPYYLTAIHREPPPASPVDGESAAKRIGSFLLKKVRERLGTATEGDEEAEGTVEEETEEAADEPAAEAIRGLLDRVRPASGAATMPRRASRDSPVMMPRRASRDTHS